MPETTSFLTPWANFYIMTGSAAAALVGLMFVVITLVTGEERTLKNPDGIATFSTPTVLHFGTALLVSAILSAPWRSLDGPSALVGVVAFGGVAYLCRVAALTRRLHTYRPDLEDWTWYTVLPFIAYGGLLVAAILLRAHPVEVLFGFGGGLLLLIFIGIHNAWDVVTFIAIGGPNVNPPP
jgi:hypothetical protein